MIAGQMDADRMDYLLRDACHTGINYGKYDLDRLVSTITLCEDSEGSEFIIR
jgi:HD superfamily phosphohydrolase